MGEKKVSLKPPAYLDREADLAFNPLQPRGADGKWIKGLISNASDDLPVLPGPPKARYGDIKHFEKTRTVSLPGVLATSRKSKTTVEGEVTRDQVRSTFKMSHNQRELLFESAGIKTHYKESETELMHRWHEHPEERKAIEREFELRTKAHKLFFSTLREAQVVADRSGHRNYFKRFDTHLKGSKVGRALLKVRDSIMADHTLDRLDVGRERVKEWGKDALKEFATSRLLNVLVSSAAVLAAHFAGSAAASETVRSLAENPIADASLGALIGLGLMLVAKATASKAKPVATAKLKGHKLLSRHA